MEHETSPQPTSLPTDHEGPGIPFRDAATPLSTDSLSTSSTSSSGSSFVKIPPGGRFILNETVVQLPFDYVPPVLRNRKRTVFQSREDELSQIDAALHPNSLQINHLENTTHKTCTITGLGGVGKTELAYRYLTRSKEKGDFDACFFVAADTPSRLREQYSRLALNLGLVSEIDEKDSETSAEIFRMWLAEPVKGIPDADKPHSMIRWLLVFDNAKDRDTLQQYIPHGTSGKIIIVSRNPLFASNQFQVSSSIRLEPFPSADAVKLLKYYADERKDGLQSTQDATEMVEWVEGLPLAVKQLGSMIHREHLTISLFRETWRTKAEFLRRFQNERDDEEGLVTIWAIDSLYKHHRGSFELLGILSLLDPELISHDLMESALYSAEFKSSLTDEASYVASRRHLVDTSLIDISRDTNDLRVHRLVQALMREVIMQKGQAADYLSMATGWIASAWPFLNRNYITGSAGKVERWVLCRPLLPHIRHLIDVYQEWIKVDPEVMKTMALPELLLEAVQYCNERSACRESLSLVALADRLYTGMALKSTLSTRYDVQASIIRARIGIAVISREGDDVLDLALQVFEIEKYRHKPPYQPSSFLAVAYNDLATGWAFRQNWAQAIQLLKESMKIRENLPGFTRDKLFSPLYHLGIVYHHQGNFDAAETSLTQAIDDRSAAFGREDKRSVRSAALYYAMGNMRLSRADCKRGDLLKALKDFGVAVEIATACMGARNRITLLCQYRKARALVSLQDNETAW
ncbi:P-loop containing nucleoside triphosphate hydrolase protein [Xylaria arbuscula]|nr:P-loop containing nucleoside triphosphate hydrolase protein [Xylaria arbuscula]